MNNHILPTDLPVRLWSLLSLPIGGFGYACWPAAEIPSCTYEFLGEMSNYKIHGNWGVKKERNKAEMETKLHIFKVVSMAFTDLK